MKREHVKPVATIFSGSPKDWKCQECGNRFTLTGAERASIKGCKCGGFDIQLVEPEATP